MFSVNFYRFENGVSPVEDFLDDLPPKMRCKAVRGLELLEAFGNTLREPYSKPISDGIFELRIKFSSDIARIFYFFCEDGTIIITNGYIKKSVRTSPLEIKLAKKYKSDYERRSTDE